MSCLCQDFETQVEIVNGPIVLQTIRSGGAYKYPGKPFKFCPWCGDELFDLATNPKVERPEPLPTDDRGTQP